MWILDPSWRNLAVGCELAKRLEAAHLERWSNPIQQAEQRAHSRARDAEAARLADSERRWAAQLAACEQRNVLARERFAERRAGWQQRDTAARQRFAQEKSAWQARETARRSAFDQLWGEWSTQDSLHRGRRRTWAWIMSSTWLAITLVGMLLGPLSPAHIGISCLAGLFAGLTMLVLHHRLLTHRAQQPVYQVDDPEPTAQFEAEPVYPGDEAPPPRPLPMALPKLTRPDEAPDLTNRWWREVHAAAHGSSQDYAHGDEGESLFIDALNGKLSHDYLAVPNLKVRKTLDVDVLVVGPSGVWVFEVKHWSGEIVCHDGDWHRERQYFEPGGFAATKVTPIEHGWDRQWRRELEAVTTTLDRRLKAPIANGAMGLGGLVFSHPGASWDVDGSCGSGYGPPEFWANTIAQQPPLPGFSEYEQLRVLDALFTWSRKLEGADHSRCAERLANELYEKLEGAARQYVQRLDVT
jgi:hypothetical protein